MSDNIIERFKQVESTLQRPIGYVHADVTNSGKIIYKTGRIATIILWVFTLLLCIAFAWVGLRSSAPHRSFDYIFLGGAGILAILLIILIPSIFSPKPYFEIDSTLRNITLYGGFPKWRPKEVIQVDNIRLFLSYVCYWSDNIQSACYVVLDTGQTYPLIAQLGSISPDYPTKTLGYICNKLAVKIIEREPALGPWAWNGPVFKPKRGGSINIERMLEISEVLYDPNSSNAPDFTKKS